MEFIVLSRGDAEGAFAIVPALNYLLASSGFFLILLWAIANGMFQDVERPKRWMLENEARLDAGSASDGELVTPRIEGGRHGTF